GRRGPAVRRPRVDHLDRRGDLDRRGADTAPGRAALRTRPAATPQRLRPGLATAHRVGAERHGHALEAAGWDCRAVAAAAGARLGTAAAARLPAAGEARRDRF